MRLHFIICMWIITTFCYKVSGTNLGKKLCNCGLSSDGADVCDCQNILIRPPPPQKLLIPNLLEEKILAKKTCPLREKCVKPVPIEKPTPCLEHRTAHHHKLSESPCPCLHKTKSIDAYEDFGYESSEEDIYYSNKKTPADSVSLTLALGLAKRPGNNVKEESLTYGHHTVPREGGVLKMRKDIPEHRLHNFDKNVFEIRKYPDTKFLPGKRKDLYESEEIYSQYSQYPTYSDLGYVPIVPKKEYKFNPRLVDYDDKYKVKQYKPKYWINGEKFWLGDDEFEEEYYSGESEYGTSSEEFRDWYFGSGNDKGIFECKESEEKQYYRNK